MCIRDSESAASASFGRVKIERAAKVIETRVDAAILEIQNSAIAVGLVEFEADVYGVQVGAQSTIQYQTLVRGEVVTASAQGATVGYHFRACEGVDKIATELIQMARRGRMRRTNGKSESGDRREFVSETSHELPSLENYWVTFVVKVTSNFRTHSSCQSIWLDTSPEALRALVNPGHAFERCQIRTMK